MPVDLSTDIARIENPYARDRDEEHGGAEDVAGVVGCEDDAAGEVDRLVVVNRLDGGNGGEDVGFRKEGVVGST